MMTSWGRAVWLAVHLVVLAALLPPPLSVLQPAAAWTLAMTRKKPPVSPCPSPTPSPKPSPTPSPPTFKWPERFSADFNETEYLPVRRNTTGTWWYDASDLDNKFERVRRDNGRGDSYCSSIHPLANMPCEHLVINDTRYIIFPDWGDDGTSCQCCTTDQGCGARDPNWLANATLETRNEDTGIEVWSLGDDDDRHRTEVYWIPDEDKIWEVDQLPDSFIHYHEDTWTTEVDPSVFELPEICKSFKRCPWYSKCNLPL